MQVVGWWPFRRKQSGQLLDWARGIVDAGVSATGVVVTEQTALTCAPVYACVRLLAESFASVPLKVYRLLPDRGRVPHRDHPLWTILHDLPNPELTSMELREALMGQLLLWGNAYAEVERDGSGRVRALWPLRADRMERIDRGADGRLRYQYRLPDHTRAIFLGPTSRQPSQILHVRGLSPDGLRGYSPIGLLREVVSLSLAAQEFGARFFGNQARPIGVLEVPRGTSERARRNLRESWRELHGGLSRAHRVAVLEEGVSWKPIGIPPEDAQFIETRKFQTTEIARIFRVPPHLIGDLERATFSNIEQQSIEFVVYSLRPWFVRWEQAIRRDLFTLQDHSTHDVGFVVEGLLRGDLKSRYEAYAVGRQWGWLSADDIRELENLNPLPDGIGASYWMPLNMVAVGPRGVRAAAAGDRQVAELEDRCATSVM